MADQGDGGGPKRGGFRRDGKPYKSNNTREDGSYKLGKGRPPTNHQFAANDGRKRGRRLPGRKNTSTILRNAIDERLTIKGQRKIGMEGIAQQLVARAIARSDRAAEILIKFGFDDESRAASRALPLSDKELLLEYMQDLLGAGSAALLDDADGDPADGPADQAGEDPSSIEDGDDAPA